MITWEYTYVTVGSSRYQALIETLNNAGSRGWEVVSLSDNETTLGMNKLVAVLKRPIVPFEPPRDLDAGWKPDPAERFQHRQWDGESWTFLVRNDGDESRDPPTKLTPAQRQQ